MMGEELGRGFCRYTRPIRIAYCTNVRLPSERAHGHQVARVCDALAKQGHEVTIFAPFRKNPIKQDYWTFHKADRKVQLKHLGTFDPIDRSWIPKILQLPILNFLLKRLLASRLQEFDLLYTRTSALLPTLIKTKKKIILELHTLPNRGRSAFVSSCDQCTLVVCLTTPMKRALESWGVATPIVVEADGIDLQMFDSHQGFVQERYSVGYAGQRESMGLSKGIPELLDAFKIVHAARSSSRCVIAGPRSKNEALEASIQNGAKEGSIIDAGFLHWSLIPTFLRACDILVYPAPNSDHPFYNRDTSPLKIFEYMAANRPIVTADLPPIRDVLDESTAFFCKPGDAEDLARVIAYVMDHPEDAKKRAEAAHKRVQHYTWDKRVQRILSRVSGL